MVSGFRVFFPERRQVFFSHIHAGGMFSQSAVSVWSIRTIWPRGILHFSVRLSSQITPHPFSLPSVYTLWRFLTYSRPPPTAPPPPPKRERETEGEKKERIKVFFNTALSKQACFLSPPTPAPVGVVLTLKTLFNTRPLRWQIITYPPFSPPLHP